MKDKLFEKIDKPKLFIGINNSKKRLFEHVSPQEQIMGNFTQNEISVDCSINQYYSGVMILDDIPPFDIVDYDLFKESDYKHYINDIKGVCRSSFEYRRFVNYLRDYMDMNKCSFFTNVSNKDTFKIRIELHHYPFTLHDIVTTVYNKRVSRAESLDVEMVAKEVMYIHYYCMVGIIPLAETVHELVHNQVLFIPVDTVFGNYKEFIDVYGTFIPSEVMEKYNAISAQTLAYNEEANLQVLQQSPLAIQLPGDDGSGLYKVAKLEEIVSLMKGKIKEIENKPKLAKVA